MSYPDDKFTEQLCRVLDQSLDEFDPAVEVRLSRMKYRALDEARSHRQRKFVWGAVPATLALLLIVVFNVPQRHIVAPDFAELNILTAPESLDFYAEDIEFYEWLSDVLETESQPPDRHSAVPDVSPSHPVDGSGNRKDRQFAITRSGTHRVYRSIYG